MQDFLVRAFREIHDRSHLLRRSLEGKKSVPELREPIKEVQRKLVATANDADEYARSTQLLTPADRLSLNSYLREYHRLARDLRIFEEQFVGHVARFSRIDKKLTKLSNQLWIQLDFPGLPPLVIASTSNYYNVFPALNIAFAPHSAALSLLTLPDLVHEFGHLIHRRHGPLFGSRTAAAIRAHCDQLRIRSLQIARPVDHSSFTRIENVWTKRWAEEVACDSLGVLLMGPSYAWCNLLLCFKNPDVAEFSTHPADTARTNHAIRVLRRQGLTGAADRVERVWTGYLQRLSYATPPHFSDYHSEDIFVAVLEDVEEQVQQLGLKSDTPLVREVNRYWDQFLTSVP